MADLFELFRKISTNAASERKPITHIVAGLGNPGDKYAFTRHNAGFMTLDYLAQKYSFKINKLKFKSLCGETDILGNRVLFMRPQTFMNLSGEAVAEAAQFYKIENKNIIIIYDDISLDIGKMRIRRKGSAGGHNGIKSIISCLGTDVFDRIKLGVGSPPEGYDIVDWVLGKIPVDCQKDFYCTVEKTAQALELILSGETERAMNLFN